MADPDRRFSGRGSGATMASRPLRAGGPSLARHIYAWKPCASVAAVMLATAPLGGCGLSSLTSGLGTGIFGGSSKSDTAAGAAVSEEQLLTAAKADVSSTGVGALPEVAHGCPKVTISPRDNNLTIYEPGRVGDGLAVVHRGEITKTARECQIEPGRVTVKYGFSGRVLLGPRGKSGPVTLPVNITVTDSKREKITGDKMSIDTAVAIENPIGYFSAVRTVTFVIPEGSRPGEFEVNLSFDRAAPGAG
ncbi:MAG: hypothetical protein ACT4N2_05625 [Hyphomicrobium sp.]